MTFIATARAAALMESRALRGYARAGVKPPRCAPVDYWDEWQRQAHCNATTKRRAT